MDSLSANVTSKPTLPFILKIGRNLSSGNHSGIRKPSAGRRKANKIARRWVAFAAAIMLVIVGFLVIRTQGFVSGSEFSPTHFQKRDFQFYEIPLLRLQITPIVRSSSTTPTATYLRQKNLIPIVTGAPEVWHLVWISRGFTGAKPADAQMLTDQLELAGSGDPYWKKWSVDHPSKAQTLWPVVQRLAERELYVLIPRLLEIAQIETAAATADTGKSSAKRTRPDDASAADLKAAIDAYLPTQYSTLVEDLRQAGRQALADEVQEDAIEDYPDTAKIDNAKIDNSKCRS